jgi:hypothetical protein
MQCHLELEASPHERSGTTAWDIVSLQKKRSLAGARQRRGAGQGGVAGADDDDVPGLVRGGVEALHRGISLSTEC